MKTKIYKLLVALMSVVVLAGCDDWTPGDGATFPANTGGLSHSMQVEVNNPPSTPTGRATADTSGFIVTVCKQGTNEAISYNGRECSWTFSEMPEIVTLPVGDYTVRVRSHEPENAAWDAPYFEGAKDFTVENNKVNYIGTVTCNFASVKVGIYFDDELKAAMDANTCSVTVDAGPAGTSLTWSTTETRYGYFYVTDNNPSLIATFSGKIKDQDVTGQKDARKEITDVKKGAYYIITFSLKGGDATLPPEYGDITGDGTGISINFEVIENPVNSSTSSGKDDGNTDGDEEDPDKEEWPEDPVDPNKPDDPNTGDDDNTISFTSETLQLGENATPNDPSITPAIVNIVAKDGITSLKVVISSDNSNFIAAVSDLLPLDFDLADIDESDELLVESLRDTLGFPINDQVTGKTNVEFNISGVAPLLSAFPGNHKFTITVTDQSGNINSTSLLYYAK